MPPRTPQPPKKNYPGTAALRPDDPNSPQNPAWGLPAGQAQPAGFMPLPPSMEDFPHPGARRYPGGLERYPGAFSDRYPSFPGWDPRMSVAPDPQPSAPIIPRRPGISDTPFNLRSGPDQDYPAERPHRPGLPPIVQDGIDRVRDGYDRVKGDAIGLVTDLGGFGVDRIADTQDGANFLSGLQRPGPAAAQPKPHAVNPAPVDDQQLLDQLARGEGTGDDKARAHGFASGYDVTLEYGRYGRSAVPLDQLTLDQIDALQTQILNNPNNHTNASAVGRYQFQRTTLRGLKRNLGLRGDEKFTPELQDRLARELLRERHVDDYRAGRITATHFQRNLQPIWVSVENPDTGFVPREGTTTEQFQAAIAPLAPKTRENATRRPPRQNK